MLTSKKNLEENSLMAENRPIHRKTLGIFRRQPRRAPSHPERGVFSSQHNGIFRRQQLRASSHPERGVFSRQHHGIFHRQPRRAPSHPEGGVSTVNAKNKEQAQSNGDDPSPKKARFAPRLDQQHVPREADGQQLPAHASPADVQLAPNHAPRREVLHKHQSRTQRRCQRRRRRHKQVI